MKRSYSGQPDSVVVIRGIPQSVTACTFISAIAGQAMAAMDVLHFESMLTETTTDSWVQNGEPVYLKWRTANPDKPTDATADETLAQLGMSHQVIFYLDGHIAPPENHEEADDGNDTSLNPHKKLGALLRNSIPPGMFAIITTLTNFSVVVYRLLLPNEYQFAFFDSHGRNDQGLACGSQSFFTIFKSAEDTLAHFHSLFGHVKYCAAIVNGKGAGHGELSSPLRRLLPETRDGSMSSQTQSTTPPVIVQHVESVERFEILLHEIFHLDEQPSLLSEDEVRNINSMLY